VEATEALVKALKSEDWKVSYGAGRAIIEAGSRIIPSLLEHLSKNESTEDRILEVLGEIKDEVSNSLFELIKDYDDKSIVAAEVISKLDNTAEYIHKALISGNRRVREAACVLLASMRRYDLLIDALEDDSWFVRFISAEALSEAEDEILKRAKDSLFRLLEDEKKIVRNSAAKTLRRLGK
jgi:HEAT repeat protein